MNHTAVTNATPDIRTIATHIVQRLGLQPTPRRVTNMVKKLVDFQKHEQGISIAFINRS